MPKIGEQINIEFPEERNLTEQTETDFKKEFEAFFHSLGFHTLSQAQGLLKMVEKFRNENPEVSADEKKKFLTEVFQQKIAAEWKISRELSAKELEIFAKNIIYK